MEIHVISLEDGILEVYHEMFPTSVVSTICAVPISKLSFYPHEEEVLLRGPFFQVLNFYKNGTIDGRSLYVIEVVMLNSNRDHPSNEELGDKADLARSVFRTIVGIRRNQFCYDYCVRKKMTDDAEPYCDKLKKDKEMLKNIRLAACKCDY